MICTVVHPEPAWITRSTCHSGEMLCALTDLSGTVLGVFELDRSSGHSWITGSHSVLVVVDPAHPPVVGSRIDLTINDGNFVPRRPARPRN